MCGSRSEEKTQTMAEIADLGRRHGSVEYGLKFAERVSGGHMWTQTKSYDRYEYNNGDMIRYGSSSYGMQSPSGSQDSLFQNLANQGMIGTIPNGGMILPRT